MEFLIGFLFGVVFLKAIGFGAVSVAEADPNTPKQPTLAVVRSSAEPCHRDAKLIAKLGVLLEKDFTVNERLILTLYYYEDLTMQDIGRALNWPESRVRQLHASILDRLKLSLRFLILYYVREFSIQDIARVMKLSESETIDLYCAISKRLNERFPFEGE